MLSSLSVANKLRAGIGLLLALLVLLGGVAASVIRDMDARSDDIREAWLPSIARIGEMNDALLGIRRHEFGTVAFRDGEMRRRSDEALAGADRLLTTALEAMRRELTDAEERSVLARFEPALRDYLGALRRTIAASAANDAEAMRRALADGYEPFAVAARALDDLVEYAERASDRAAADANEAADTGLMIMLGVVLAALALGIAVAVLLGRSISGRITDLSSALGRLAQRDYGFELEAIADKDEIGGMARAIDGCRDGLKEADRLAAAQIEEAKKQAERATRVDALVKEFEAEAAGVLRAVSSAATELSATAGVMTETAEDGTRQAAAVAAASEQASTNVQTVAASAEELATSIAEVARQVRETAAITERAAGAAQSTDNTVRGLAEAATKIGDVVRLISDIAGQTNLLALNATIEAARAGEAGKGFAVVASEVKNLASQTARATEEIGQQISAMQMETSRTVEAIAAIARTIEELNATTAQVAAASEQQAAATQEIGRAVAEAAQGTQEASRSAVSVKQGAERTGGAAQDLKGASSELAQQSERLRGQVDGFLANIRAA